MKDGEQLSLVLQTALHSRKYLFRRHQAQNQGAQSDFFPLFVLDVSDEPVLFEGQKLYYCNSENIIVIRSDSMLRRGFTTDPSYYSGDNMGNQTLNYIVSSIFEGMVRLNRLFLCRLDWRISIWFLHIKKIGLCWL